MIKNLFIILCILFFTFSVHATIYEVDSNADMTAANANADDGDTVNVDGTKIYNVGVVPTDDGVSYISVGGMATITGVSIGVDLKYRHHIVVDGFKILNTSSVWVSMSYGAASYNTIQNCYMEASDYYVGILLMRDAHHNKILNNTLIGYCGPNDLIQFRSASYNLIEGNKLYFAPHTSIGIHSNDSLYNIIRYNYIQNKWHNAISYEGSTYTLVENNIVVDSGEDHQNNSCGTDGDREMVRYAHKGISLGLNGGIVRKNVLINTGNTIDLVAYENPALGQAENLMIYNNTSYGNHRGFMSAGSVPTANNVIKNNIITNSVEYELYIVHDSHNYYIKNIFGITTIYWNNDTDTRVDNIIIADPIVIGTGLLSEGFTTVLKYNNSTNEVDPGGSYIVIPDDERSVELQLGSPMIAAGTWLTTITSETGSGTTFTVDDARYFMDGWGIIDGDKIQLEGKSSTVGIINISGNTITVDRSISWTQGDGVSLSYNGKAPDMGAHESPETRHLPAINFLLLN